MFSYACCSAALYMGLLFEKSGERWLFVVQVILLMASIGSYESFNAVFVCEVLFILSLRAIYDHSTVRQIIFSGLKYAAALLLAVVSYYAMVKFFQFITENPAYARSNLISSGGSLWESVDNVVSELRASPFFFASEFALSCFASGNLCSAPSKEQEADFATNCCGCFCILFLHSCHSGNYILEILSDFCSRFSFYGTYAA